MNNITEKELSASARHSSKSHQHGKTSKSNQKKISPEWKLSGRIKRRIQLKKDTNADFSINDKFSNKLNEKYLS